MGKEIRFNSWGIPYIVEFNNIKFRSSSTPPMGTRSRPPRRNTVDAIPITDALGGRPMPVRSDTWPKRKERNHIPQEQESTRGRSFFSFKSRFFSAKASPLPPASDKKLREASSKRDTPTRGRQNHRQTQSTRPASHDRPLPQLPKHQYEPEAEALLIRFSDEPDPLSPIYSNKAKSCPNLNDGASSTTTSSSDSSQFPKRVRHLRRAIEAAVIQAGMSTPPSSEDVSSENYRQSQAWRQSIQQKLFSGTYGQVLAAMTAAGLTAKPCAEGAVGDAIKLGAMFVAKRDERRDEVVLSKITLFV